MKSTLVTAALAGTLVAAAAIAQSGPGTQKPAGQTPAQRPAPGQRAPAPPFPQGAKIAYINLQRIASESNEGKASSAKVQALQQKKLAELNEKNKALQATQQRLQASPNDRQLQKEGERLQLDMQRAQQDAQNELQQVQQQLQGAFERRLMPIVRQIAAEKGLQMVVSQADAGIVWADTGLDLSAEIIRRLDAAGAKPPGK